MSDKVYVGTTYGKHVGCEGDWRYISEPIIVDGSRVLKLKCSGCGEESSVDYIGD